MSITTRKGDDGTTRLHSGERISKADPRMDAVGHLDELVSALGVARAQKLPPPLNDAVLTLQRDLFVIGTELASRGGAAAMAARSVDGPFLSALETRRDRLEAEIQAPRDFILPGETLAGAHLDLARSIARRLERCVAGLPEEMAPPPRVLVWLNRLSDYLWLLARAAEIRSRPLKGGD